MIAGTTLPTTTQSDPLAQPERAPERSFRQEHRILWTILHRPSGLFGIIVLLLIVCGAIFAPWIAPNDPNAQDLTARFAKPGTEGYLLGADAFGRDILSRLLYGGRISLTVGLVSSAISLGVGIPLGIIAGYSRGWFDTVLMRIVDVLLAFPYLLLAIVIVGTLGPSLRNTIIAVSITNIPFYLRVMRSAVLSVRERTYVEAAKSLGASNARILTRAVFPSILPFVIVSFSISVGWLILSAAGLSFLGLGAQPPSPEWGAMLSENRQYLAISPHTVYMPGAMIVLVVLALNMLGDAIRDGFDVTVDRM